MAELKEPAPPGALPPLGQQLRAVAWLRWRILVNGFRRKGGATELIGRLVVFPLLAAMALLPTVAAAAVSWYAVQEIQFGALVWVFWGAFALAQLLNINLGQQGTGFQPTELIRFPFPLWRYVVVRLSFGVFSAGNLIVLLMSGAAAAAIAFAAPALLPAALGAIAVFALSNVLFTRMVFAWVDRWLSTRRARELFTAVIFLFSIGAQYANVRYNPGLNGQIGHHHRRSVPSRLPARLGVIQHELGWLPPGLTAGAITAAHAKDWGRWAVDTAADGGFALLFLGVFTARMAKEYRGEHLGDAAHAVAPVRRPLPPEPTAAAASRGDPERRRWPPRTLLPLLGKELLTMRRNVGLFYGLVAPAVMVFLFAGRLSTRNDSHWVVLGAVAYALLGISALSYNTFGLEGTGVQFYFFSPVPLREVFFAKNVFTLLLAMLEVITVVAITTYILGEPRPVDCLYALLWAVGTLLVTTTVGNLRSVSAPKKVNPGRTMNRAQSAVSGYIAMGILAGCAALGFGGQFLERYVGGAWIGLVLMIFFALGGMVAYLQSLNGIEAYALAHRETLLEEFGRKT